MSESLRIILRKPYFKSQLGSSLIEVMAAVGIIGVVAMSTLTFGKQSALSNEDVRTRNNFKALANMVRATINVDNTCRAAFGVGTSTPVSINLPTSAPGAAGQPISLNIAGLQGGVNLSSPILQAGQTLPAMGLTVNQLNLINVVATGNTLVPAGQVEYFVQLSLAVSRLTNGLEGGAVLPTTLVGGVTVQADATGKVIGCAQIPATSVVTDMNACAAIGCTWTAANPVGSQCVCNSYLRGCPLPGTYPVQVSNGTIVCQPLGSGTPCPLDANGNRTYLRGVSLNKNYCAALSQVSLSGAACTIPARSAFDLPAVAPLHCQIDNTSNVVLPSGSSVTLNDTSSAGNGYTGSITYSCDASAVLTSVTNSCTSALPCSAAAGALSWTVAGATCVNDSAVSNVASGSTVAVNDILTGANRGGATYTCTNGVLALAGAPAATCAPPAAGSCYEFTQQFTTPNGVTLNIACDYTDQASCNIDFALQTCNDTFNIASPSSVCTAIVKNPCVGSKGAGSARCSLNPNCNGHFVSGTPSAAVCSYSWWPNPPNCSVNQVSGNVCLVGGCCKTSGGTYLICQ